MREPGTQLPPPEDLAERPAARTRELVGRLLPFLLILPALIYFGVFFAFPLAQGLGLAFTTREGEWTLENFEKTFTDIRFKGAIFNTLLLVGTVIPIQLALALTIALLVNSRLFGSSTFLYIAAIPIAISEIAAGIIWLSIFTPRGYFNTFLHTVGLVQEPVIYLSQESPGYLLTAIILTEVWRATAIVMVILVAGLQMISKDYLDAADIFGATRLQKLRHVILPLLKPSIQTALIIRTVLAFQLFAPVLVLAGRLLPVMASETYLLYSELRNPHLASAYGIVIMAFSTAFVLFYLTTLRTRWKV